MKIPFWHPEGGQYTPPGRTQVTICRPRAMRQPVNPGEIRRIGAATPGDYQRALEQAPWLDDYFQPVNVLPPNETEAISILFALRGQGAVREIPWCYVTDEALRSAVYDSDRDLPERCLPVKAIDLIDEAGACVKLPQRASPENVIGTEAPEDAREVLARRISQSLKPACAKATPIV